MRNESTARTDPMGRPYGPGR